MHTSSRPASLPALTGMRFCAATVVVASHFLPGGLPAGDIGAAAVTLFFLLSGFILTYTARPGRLSVRDFYVARFARIYPAYLLSLTVAALLPHVPSNVCPVPSSALLPDLFAVQAWLPDRTLCLNGPAWSVSCEMFFYTLFPLLLPLVRRVPQARLPLAFGGCWACGLALPLAFLLAHPAGETGGLLFRLLHLSPAARLPDFACGMLLGRLYLAGWRVPHSRVALAISLAWLPVVQYGVGLFGPLDDALCWPAFAVLLLILAQGLGMAPRLLSQPALVLLGEASYALYILHWPLHGVMQSMGLLSPLGSGWFSFAAYATLAVAVSLLSLRFVETPLRRAIRAAACLPQVERTIPAWTAVPDCR